MEECRLAEVESKFVELVWKNEPIGSGDLVKLCEKELNWNKSTTYTVLRRLCQRGILQNKETIVTSLIKKDEFYSIQSKQFVEDTFGGSLPKFVAAFTRSKKLSDKEIDELQRFINEHEEGKV
ncbi:MAG: BlaI/MecI/CopY family transcriptional regulator [Clostridia bacterium]|nr:BlaI/MecI/CopY family transcriptional regulator [Clostridia bacterium]MDD4047519.1 BlaI/MecI/CopY family transcriptional regulator [Clostridia bacterium]